MSVVRTILWAENKLEAFHAYANELVPYLAERGIAVQLIHAINGNAVFRELAAIKHHNSKTPDLLIVDIDMPEWNGIKTVTELAPQWPNLPKIVLSTLTDTNDNPEVLSKLTSDGAIRSYHSPGPSSMWKEAVLTALSVRDGNILHISDVHFGETHAFVGRLSLLEMTKLFIQELDSSQRPNLVVMSGDLTNTAQSAEFTRGYEYLEALLESLNLGPERLVIVPGNHDIFRGEERDARLEKYTNAMKSFYAQTQQGGEVLKSYPFLLDRTRDSKGSLIPTEDRICSVRAFDDLKLVVIAMSSAIVDHDRYDWGEISEPQLLKIREQLKKLMKPQSDYLRLAVFHHHLFPVPSFRHDGYPERVIRKQALVLKFLLGMHVQLILHGHTHYTAGYKYLPYFIDGETKQIKPIFVLGTGTLASTEREGSQAWFHLSMIGLKTDSSGAIVKAEAQPFRLRDDTLTWESHPVFSFDLTSNT